MTADVIVWMKHYARTSAKGASDGYKSGRSSWRDTPEMRSTASTRSGGTSSHWETACSEMPRGEARPAKPPTAKIARFKASDLSFMGRNSSMALPESQALLHCPDKAVLYNVEMTLGKRIKAARERLKPKPTQGDIAAYWKISDKAVSAWERDETVPEVERLADLASLLKVPSNWLLKGRGAPPDPDSLESELDDLSPSERAILAATLKAIRNQRKSA